MVHVESRWPPRSSFRLGDWTVHPPLNCLARGGQMVSIQPRVMQVLACLATRPAEVFSRDELLDAVWGSEETNEESLTRAIASLRRALRDDPREPRYLETIRGGGYRLIASISSLEGPLPTSVAFNHAPDAPVGPGTPRFAWMIAAGLIAVALLVAGILQWRRVSLPPSVELLEGLPITSSPGSERFPALSPDGTRIAFARQEEPGGNLDIYVQQLGAETPVRLTDDEAHEHRPAWSPDGCTLAFLRASTPPAVCTVPAIGGPVRTLFSRKAALTSLDWSPDGTWLALSIGDGPDDQPRIQRLWLESGEVTSVTMPPEEGGMDARPAIAPDGNRIAFVRSVLLQQDQICIVASSGDRPRCLTRAFQHVNGIDWTTDGRHLILSAGSGLEADLWRLALGSGALTRLATPGGAAIHPTLPARAPGLAYETLALECNIWKLALDRPGDADKAADVPLLAPLISSTRLDRHPQISPDGEWIAFTSDRTGSPELWLCDAAGDRLRQLTSNGGLAPHHGWSPDGKRLAVSARTGEITSLFVVDITSAHMERVHPSAKANEFYVDWSADGRWIYFHTESNGVLQLWKVRPDGTGSSPVLPPGRLLVHACRDGSGLWYNRMEEPGLWFWSLPDSVESCRIAPETMARWRAVAFFPDGVFVIRRFPEELTLSFYDLAAERFTSLAVLPRDAQPGLVVSPDQRWALIDRMERMESDLVSVGGFQ